MNKPSILIAFALLLTIGAQAQRDTVVPQTHRFVFRGTEPLFLDVYRPEAPRPDSACVVYIFGGGFITGSRQDAMAREYCQRMAARGFCAIAIDYRLILRRVNPDTVSLFNTQRIFRDAIHIATSDCAAALSYICRHASEWGIATNRILLCGCSAGAITALQLDYCRANAMPIVSELPAGFKPAGVVAYAGAVYSDGGKPRYATPPAPTFFLHGTQDRIVHYRKFPPVLRSGDYGTKKLQKLFARKGYPHWVFRYEGIGHEVAAVHILTIPEFCAFADAVLSGRQMYYDATVRDTNVVPTRWSRMNVFDLYRQ